MVIYKNVETFIQRGGNAEEYLLFYRSERIAQHKSQDAMRPFMFPTSITIFVCGKETIKWWNNSACCICALLYEKTGTGQTVRHARKKGLRIVNVI